MKLNGKNIILDDDVTMTGKNLGEKLSDVVGELQSKTSKLENYLKWIYKYGGVGGSGGNGGGSSTYSLYAELAGVALAGQNISLGSAGVYTLYFKISRPEGATFNVTYEYTAVINSVATTIKKKVILDVSNSYEYSVNLELNSNATIFVTAVDSIYNETKQLSANYITKSYEFGIRLANNNEETLNNEIFTTTARNNGLNVFLDYEIAVFAGMNYSLSFNTPDKKSIVVDGQLDQDASKKGKIQFDLVEIGREEEGWEPKEENSGYYSGQITVNINIVGQGIKTETFPFNFTLIPQDLYLLVQPVVGNIYTSQQTVLAYLLDSDGNRTGVTTTISKEEFDAGKGTLYETDNDIYEYTPGNISFNLKAYYGTQIESPVEIDYYLEKEDESPAIGQVISTLRKQNSIRIYSTKTGWNKIRFQLRCQGIYYPERNDYVTYYFYIKQSDTKIDWYDSTRSGKFNYCRGDNYSSSLKDFYELTTGAPYQQTINKSELELTDLDRPDNPEKKYNTNIALGIMYSDINNDNSTILKCIQTINGYDTVQVEITQNTVKIGNNTTINYYLPKTENYHAEGFNYHVLNIVSRFVSNNGTTDYYEILVYIDGKIEGASQSYSDITLRVDKLVIGNVNCMINMLEVSYLDTVYEDKKSKVEDLTIYQYYLKYKSVFGGTVSDDEVALITYVNGFTVNNNGDVYCEEDTVSNISQYVDIPTLLITVNDPSNSLKTYLDTSYAEEATTNDIEATLKWSGGKGKGELLTVDSPANAYFTITIQGSSTKAYKCKNYDLTIHNRDKSENASLYLYSPNFSNTDTSTFLPEQTFTLKADVVDSSHSNNTSIGKFVNAITAPFDTKQSGVLRSHIKNCLDGFPVLVYIQFVRKDEITEAEVAPCYFQGVYNFNLGRKSFYNLGYKDSSVFCNPNGSSKLSDAGNNFIFYEVPASEDHLKNGVIVAEVQGNSPYFDFSQWDETILYNYYNNNKETYMFGDLVNGSGLNETQSKKIIQNLVNHVALAGGYLFGNELMKKSFSESEEDHYGYDTGYNAVGDKIDRSGNTLKNVPLNQVPNYRKQFKKELDSGGNQIYSLKPNEIVKDVDVTDLTAILGDEDNNIAPWFDYRSLSEYYTICMAFGLVDSVQKNLNIKSWNADPSGDSGNGYAKFYAAFYDMDTCLGINNKGTDVSYFAFSDYWGYNDIENASGSMTPTYVTIYRDYSPKAEGDSSDFYDTASSYLFAIAKYARYKNKTETTTFWPKELWAKWRGSRTSNNDPSYGCLRSAKTFIDNYFANNLGKVPAALINANYRNKYLVIYSTDSNQYQFSQINWEKFNGTRIAKAEDWLEGRFHILDAYFNLPNANSPIQHWEKKRGTNEGVEFDYDDYTAILTSSGAIINDPDLTNDYLLKANTDIFVLQDIFSGSSNNQGSGTLNINIKAREYSPLIAEIANNIYRYLLGGEKLYNIVIPLSGTQTYKFNGSGAWTELDSINTFNFSNLQVNSKYLETLSGNASNSMRVTANGLNMPSLKTLVLSSNTYTGNLVLDGTNFPNLGSVDVSNSSISLDISNSDLTRVNIANMTGSSASVSVTSCKSLQEINFGNTTLGSCTINPLPVELATATEVGERSFGSGGFEISDTKITSLSLTNSKNTGGNTRLSIVGDESLTTLSVSGFATVYIENCPKLINIYITDPQNNSGEITGDYLEKLYINNCGGNNNKFRIGTVQTAVRIADLTAYTELKYLKISNCKKLTEVKFINDSDKYIDLAPEAFREDTSLKFINGTSSIWITGPYTFRGCKAFTLKQGDGGAMSNIQVRDYVANLLSTFYIPSGGGAITRALAKAFIEGAISENNKVTNISHMFRGQNITYTKDNLISDLKGQTHDYIDMSRLKKVTNASYAFGWNDISAWHRKWYSFGSEVTDINFSSYMVTSSRTIYTTLDVYEDIIDKVDVLGWQQHNSVDLYPELQFVDSGGNTITDDINIAELFHPGGKHPDNCKILRYMDFSNTQNLSLSGVFENWSALEKIERFMFKREYTNCKDLDGLLYPLTNLKYVKDSFRISAIVNLANFCNWRALRYSTYDPFQSRTVADANYNLGNFTIQKYITVDEFNELIGTTIGDPSCNWTGISNLFRNCTLITNSDDHVLSLGNNVNEKIKAIDGTFYNFRVVKVNGGIDPSNIPQNSTYVTLSDNLLRIFPYLTSAGYTFYGMKIANQLPYNFFGKRYYTTTDIYIMDENSDIPDKGKDRYEASEYGEDFIQAKLYNYDYRRELINLRYCFKYTKWKQDTINGVNARSFYPTTIDENRIVLSDGSGTVMKTEGLYYFKKVIETTYDSEGNPESKTYFERNRVPFRRSTEITDTEDLQEDTEDLQGRYAKTIIGYGRENKFTNYEVDNSALTRCFVAPDILYGVTSSCNIDGVFDSTEDGENLETLEGIIPANLLKNCMSSSFPNLMRNLNIIPNYLGKYNDGVGNIYKIYNYIPENFTSATVLDNAFNFHFLLPRAKTVANGVTTYYKHYLLLNSSVTSNARGSVSSIDFGVPSVYYNDSTADVGLFVGTAPYGFPNTHTYDYGIYYNLMFTPSYDSTGSLVSGTEGIDMTSYSALNLDNLLSPIISFFMSGQLFNSSFLLNNAKKNKENYIIDTFPRVSDDYVVSRNIIFPQARENSDFSGENIFYYGYGSTTLKLYSSQVGNSKAAYETITMENDSTRCITFED